MSGPDQPAAPPPEVPEEFAAVYREAYQRALVDPNAGLPEVPPHEVVRVGTHRSDDDAVEAPGLLTRWRAERWFLPVLLGAGALLLVGGAYAVGAALSGEEPGPASGTAPTRTTAPPRSSPHASPSTTPKGGGGPVKGVAVDAIAADCTEPPGRDSAGHKVSYAPENAIDGRAATAWRCPGTAIGQRLTLRLGGEEDIAQVGLIPGYAKTDPLSGVDRYAENNRITRVRWTLGDGVHVVQELRSDPSSRAVQVLRVPRTTTDTVILEILAVDRGSRNTTAISEVTLAAAG